MDILNELAFEDRQTRVNPNESTQTVSGRPIPNTTPRGKIEAFKEGVITQWAASLSPAARRTISTNDIKALGIYIDAGARKLLSEMATEDAWKAGAAQHREGEQARSHKRVPPVRTLQSLGARQHPRDLPIPIARSRTAQNA